MDAVLTITEACTAAQWAWDQVLTMVCHTEDLLLMLVQEWAMVMVLTVVLLTHTLTALAKALWVAVQDLMVTSLSTCSLTWPAQQCRSLSARPSVLLPYQWIIPKLLTTPISKALAE